MLTTLGLVMLQFEDAGAWAGVAALFTGAWLVVWLILAILMIVGFWKIFTKAGKPGWYSLIPILNIVTLCQIVGWTTGKILALLFVPIVNVILSILLCVDLAKAFGKGTGFAIGLLLFPFIFYPILGFGDAKYLGPPSPSA